jgi:hypothetical protein
VHYVVAGFAGLFALFPLLHVAMGLGIVTGVFPTVPRASGARSYFRQTASTLFPSGSRRKAA